MIASSIPLLENPVRHHAEAHDDFIPLIAIVDRHARVVFRHLPAADREEAATEAVAAAFKAFVRLKARGKPVNDLRSGIAAYAVLHTKSGRRVGGHLNSNDVLSGQAQRKHGFKVESLSMDRSFGGHDHRRSNHQPDPIEEQLRENSRTPPSEQAAFRIDFRDWLAAWSHRDRKMIHDLGLGERTADVAKKYGITPGRVSQRRRQYQNDWRRYYDEPAEAGNVAGVA